MQGNYPVYKLSNGVEAKFMCLNKEGLELYKNMLTNQNNLIKDNNDSWSLTDGSEYGNRFIPLFGVKIIETMRWDMF